MNNNFITIFVIRFILQSLYGKKEPQRVLPTTTRRTTTTTRRPSSSNNGGGSRVTPAPPPPVKVKLCTDPKPDAITVMADGATYVFKGKGRKFFVENCVILTRA